ncbi:ABC transporter permease subunit [Bradyrhizobium sp. Pear76]|uniref:ABC transporter permease n=1 Tax=Bradyrhizobium oropedii TaxID=1571201 RepID=UPI00237B3BD8|nr:ABC transporter permease subunit [Bradyrhizobium oropedii]MCC8967276.1 ABC transporter permease subunit [Bradyrhizobium oropedii]
MALVAGLMAALGLRRFRGRAGRLLVTLFILPAMIPTMIYSIGAYFSAVRVGLTDTVLGIGIAHAVLGLPFVVIICATALSAIKPSVEMAAQSLGARRFARFRRIVLPLIAPSLLAGGLVAFQTSFDEIVVALFMSGVETRTLPKQMWQATTLEVTPIIPAAAVVVLLLILLAAVCVLAIRRVLRWKP